MSPALPEILQRYFAAQNAHDIDALVACFAPDARVRDEGRNIVGTDAIRAWKAETSAKYGVTASRANSVATARRPSSSRKCPARSPAARRT
jgi:hypothetical protein